MGTHTGAGAHRRLLVALIVAVGGAAALLTLVDNAETARASAVAWFCLVLWLSEAVAVFVPTLLLALLVPVALGHLGPEYSLRSVMSWGAEPVIALFFGGFALGTAASVHGIDRMLARAATRIAGRRADALVAVLLGTTAFLSMWMSNIAAAALMISALQPMMRDPHHPLRRPLLLAVAFGANLGGMATPIGTGPNAIAMAEMPGARDITFAGWMGFALPLTTGALLVAWLLIVALHRVRGQQLEEIAQFDEHTEAERPRLVGLLALGAIVLWLSEPLHGIPSPNISIAIAVLLFGSGLLPAAALARIDWSTLVVIGGGIMLGRLIEDAGLFNNLASALVTMQTSRIALTAALVAASALLSAVMSNTAAATMLIPMGLALLPESTGLPVLIAMGASFGMPFVISTPPNAMAVGAGLRPRDLLVPGLILMVGGCILIASTGHTVLAWLGY